MDYKALVDGIKRFGSDERDICLHNTGIAQEQVSENVIIAPWWEPDSMPSLGKSILLTGERTANKAWSIDSKEAGDITYLKTGIGAPCLIDTLLALGVTKCKNIIFIGSVGSLDKQISIGDVVIPEYSVCGDGASRYIASDSLSSGDVFGEKVYPDIEMYDTLLCNASSICRESNVICHIAKVFSIDTVFAQFAHLDEILALGCNVIEMETSAAFRASKLTGLKTAALLSVSDSTAANKSLISGRTEDEQKYRKKVRREMFPQIIIDTFRRMK